MAYRTVHGTVEEFEAVLFETYPDLKGTVPQRTTATAEPPWLHGGEPQPLIQDRREYFVRDTPSGPKRAFAVYDGIEQVGYIY
jgi:hypothetical protein